MNTKFEMDDEIEGFNQRKPIGVCGKICFSKKSAQTKKNWLEFRGRIKKLKIYQCPQCNAWHMTKQQ